MDCIKFGNFHSEQMATNRVVQTVNMLLIVVEMVLKFGPLLLSLIIDLVSSKISM